MEYESPLVLGGRRYQPQTLTGKISLRRSSRKEITPEEELVGAGDQFPVADAVFVCCAPGHGSALTREMVKRMGRVKIWENVIAFS